MKYYENVEKVKYEGSKSLNPFAFKYYNPEEVIMGKKMKDHLKFGMAYWHTFTGMGEDPFGSATMERPWDDGLSGMDKAKARVKVAFEFMEKVGIEYFCFHDRDIAPEGDTLEESNKSLRYYFGKNREEVPAKIRNKNPYKVIISYLGENKQLLIAIVGKSFLFF